MPILNTLRGRGHVQKHGFIFSAVLLVDEELAHLYIMSDTIVTKGPQIVLTNRSKTLATSATSRGSEMSISRFKCLEKVTSIDRRVIYIGPAPTPATGDSALFHLLRSLYWGTVILSLSDLSSESSITFRI